MGVLPVPGGKSISQSLVGRPPHRTTCSRSIARVSSISYCTMHQPDMSGQILVLAPKTR
jgi:hypothetical protein